MRKGYKVTVSLNKKPLKKLKIKKRKPKKEIKDENITKGIDIVNSHKNKQEEVRQERIGKTLVEVHNEILDIEKERRERNRFRRRVATVIVLLIIFIFVYLFISYGPILGISLFKGEQINEENKIDIVSTDEDIYKKYCDELLIYNNRKLMTYNNNARKTWEYELQEVFTPNIYINGKYMVVANTTNGTIYLFENKKELLTKRIDGTISYVYVNSNGDFAVEYSTNGYKKVIGVYSKSGKLLYNTYLQSPTILDIKFIDKSNKLLVITSDSSSFNMGSILNIVDGTKKEDNIKEIARLENNFIYDIVIKNKNAIIMLDNKIVNYNLNTGTVTEVKNFSNSQVLFTSLSNTYYTLVEKDLNSDLKGYRIKTVRFDNTDISVTNVDNSPKVLKNSGYLNYFIYQDKLQVINKWGVEIKNINITFPPKDVVILNKEKCIALIYSNKIYFVNM